MSKPNSDSEKEQNYANSITHDEWVERFKPDVDENGEIMPYETYGSDLNSVLDIASSDPGRVWTVVEDDNGIPVVLSGYHLVNRLYYHITENSFDGDHLNVIDSDYDEMVDLEKTNNALNFFDEEDVTNLYVYTVDIDERGEFASHLRRYLTDEIIESFDSTISIMNEGVSMRDAKQVGAYLVSVGALPEYSRFIPAEEEIHVDERLVKEAGGVDEFREMLALFRKDAALKQGLSQPIMQDEQFPQSSVLTPSP